MLFLSVDFAKMKKKFQKTLISGVYRISHTRNWKVNILRNAKRKKTKVYLCVEHIKMPNNTF